MTRWPVYDDDQIAQVAAVLRSGKVNAWTGPHVQDFENEYARCLGRKHAIALANGTVALDLALYTIGLANGDEVIVTPRSFVASASCVVMAGGIPIFADVDRDSQNITAETIRAQISPLTKAIIIVHLAGWPCDMTPIVELAERMISGSLRIALKRMGRNMRANQSGRLAISQRFHFVRTRSSPLVAKVVFWPWTTSRYGKRHGAARTMENPTIPLLTPNILLAFAGCMKALVRIGA